MIPTTTRGSNPFCSATLTKAPYSPREFVGIKPDSRADFSFESGLFRGKARSLFSERPIYLRSSGLHGFGTVLEIPTFRSSYEFPRKEVLRLLWDRREHPIPNSRRANRRGIGPFRVFDSVSVFSVQRSQCRNCRKSPAFSGEYARFEETIGGDRLDRACSLRCPTDGRGARHVNRKRDVTLQKRRSNPVVPTYGLRATPRLVILLRCHPKRPVPHDRER
jgi:hypothetical protein